MLRNYEKRDTAMGRDISYHNNATLCVNRLEESVRVFSSGHVSILGFDRPCSIQQIHQDFGSRVLVSRKHSYRVRLDWSQALVWESIWLGGELHRFSFCFFPSLGRQLDCFTDTERSQILMALKGPPPYNRWHKSFKMLKNSQLNSHGGWSPTNGFDAPPELESAEMWRDLIVSVSPPQIAWYLAGGTCTNGSDHIDRRSPLIQAIPKSGMRVKGTR